MDGAVVLVWSAPGEAICHNEVDALPGDAWLLQRAVASQDEGCPKYGREKVEGIHGSSASAALLKNYVQFCHCSAVLDLLA